jgi:GNAT superfamily N-acetyltransferase
MDSSALEYREAGVDDYPGLHRVRLAVKENVLSHPDRIREADYIAFLTTKGRGWCCTFEGELVGFAILDTEDHNIWALFVAPEWQSRGIGKELQRLMLDWHFSHSDERLWLSTGPNTRAERFYTLTGWKKVGKTASGEWRFEIGKAEWESAGSSV